MEKEYYLNPKIKRANLKEVYTQEQIEEYVKCAQDPTYFIENYVKIVTLDRGLQPFHLRGYQRNLIETYHNNLKTILLSARQSGKTITTVSYILWYICFNTDKTAVILANKAATAREILSKLIGMLEELPFFLQPGVKVLNKGSVEFGNNSRIIASSTSSSSIRGFSVNLLYLDEFAFVQNAVEFFRSSYPTITAGKTSKIIISSTFNGLNLFYSLWTEAKRGENGFHPFEVNWWEVPGRDENWKREQVSILGEEGFAQEYGNEAIGSSNTLIAPSKLKQLTYIKGRKDLEGYEIIEDPIANHNYVITADVSRGTENDFSVAIVLDVTQFPIKIVATYRNNQLRPILFPDILYKLAKKYNEAYVMVERNSNGQDVIDILFNEYEYENIFSTKMKQKVGQVLSIGISRKSVGGIEMTKSVKKIGCSNLKALIEEDKLINLTENMLLEFYNFSKKGSSYEADQGTDDMVMSLVMFSWAINQQFFKDMFNADFRKEIFTKYVNETKEDDIGIGLIVDSAEIRERHENHGYQEIIWKF